MSADPTVQATELDLDNEAYDSAEDEDFEFDAAQDDSDVSLSSDDENEAKPATKRRKLNKKVREPEEKELDSGDEATIRKAKEKRHKGKKSKDDAKEDKDEDDICFDDEEESGAGGFVKTRAMRMQMIEERKPLAKIEGATVDVDALWARMNSSDTNSGLLPSQIQPENQDEDAFPLIEEIKEPAVQDKEPEHQEKQTSLYAEEMVKIKRTYKFAGEIITEEKIVPKDSAEAKLFLANGENVEPVTADELAETAKSAVKLRRPLRKVSRFDPNPTGSIKKSWEKQQIVAAADANAKGPRINTVEKSRLDWAKYVDKAGIRDELNVHSKAKEGYLGRMDFLDRVDSKREEERKAMRLKGL
ncbi:hypothetical protein ASPZODRAFT_17212 [Penicilliopsis zonata CBS 506.65]|uniref:SWR1-complex protein 5 n=1 Tax=Penicilliopsis zonata CBS 506.65 TaxID=1073090 RepID=A0A1L9SF12_9EURO|nr:hypothetical protein ASPZODRAFT_17212 [Penicilliopsis zonata CBS 506.65]OJJ45771.1 hypothetical protein ASPZODRAFT_17212 [Penicilliopsis zonata CBS 506.65]